MRAGRYVAAAAIPLLLTSAGCSKDKDKAAAGKSCAGLLEPANPAANLPAGGVPAGVTGATFFEVDTAGATKTYFAYVDGTDVVKTRDGIKAAYEAASVTVKGTDQEPGAEAELEFATATQEGTVQTINLCEGKIRIRYKVGPK